MTSSSVAGEQIVAVKKSRVMLDRAIKELRSLTPSREVSLSITKAQECKMWLGQELNRLGSENPYPNSIDPSNTIIDPETDVSV